jgi:hypothetical protein
MGSGTAPPLEGGEKFDGLADGKQGPVASRILEVNF